MKNLKLLPFLLLMLSLSACRDDADGADDEDNALTILSEEQVLKLSPYMTEVKREGDLIVTADTLKINDSIKVIQPRSAQLFTFRVMVDEKNVPIMPDTTTTTERRIGEWRNGGIKTFCMGGCIQFVGSSLCLADPCTPMDNACGCIPPVCGGGCELWQCSSEILGFTSGKINM